MQKDTMFTLLFRLHASASYRGFYPMIRCLSMLCEDGTLASDLMAGVLGPVAELYGITVPTLYRRLSYLITAMFRDAPMERWEELGLSPLEQPSVGQFLCALSWKISQEEKSAGLAEREAG